MTSYRENAGSKGSVLVDGDVVEALVEHGLIVVHIQDDDCHGGRDGLGRHSGVGRDHHQLRLHGRLAIQSRPGRDQSRGFVNLEPVRVRGGGIQHVVVDAGVFALVVVLRRHLEDGGATGQHLLDLHLVGGLYKMRRVVVEIRHVQREGFRRAQRWNAAISSRDGQSVVRFQLPVQGFGQRHKIHQVVTGAEAEVTIATRECDIHPGVVLGYVRVADGNSRDEISRRGLLGNPGCAVVGQVNHIYSRFIVIDIQHFNGHNGRRLQFLNGPIPRHYNQLIRLLAFVVDFLVDLDFAVLIDGECLLRITSLPVNHVGDPAIVSGVRIQRRDLQNARAYRGVLQNLREVSARAENGLIVIYVHNGDVHDHVSGLGWVSAVKSPDQ